MLRHLAQATPRWATLGRPALALNCIAGSSTSDTCEQAPKARALSSEGASAQDEGSELILHSRKLGVSLLTLNRPDKLNALSSQMFACLLAKLHELDNCPDTRTIIITGAGRAFAAGADIAELAQCKSYIQAYEGKLLENWGDMMTIRKPVIAAVNGPALGGGCELAMACDIAVASEDAVFGLPEVSLGLIPGGGGTQRLARRIGKARAMELILTGDKLSAWEAERVGIVSRVVKRDQLMDIANGIAHRVASFSRPVVAKAKECINASFEMPLEEGLLFEKREFWSCFALEDSQEGMAAFLEKRRAAFADK